MTCGFKLFFLGGGWLLNRPEVTQKAALTPEMALSATTFTLISGQTVELWSFDDPSGRIPNRLNSALQKTDHRSEATQRTELVCERQARAKLLALAALVLFPLLWWEREAVKQMETRYGK